MKNLFDFGSIGDAMKNLQNAYGDGLKAMGQAGKQASKDMEPSHKILVDVKLLANVENYDYKIDAHLEFLADLNSILQSQGGDIMSVLGGLNVDLSEQEKSQVAEELGKPKCVAVLDTININDLKLYSDSGREQAELNKDGTMLISLDKDKLTFSFESVLSFPKLAAEKTIYFAVPSMERMQENISLSADSLQESVKFEWEEKDKDNLKIEGTLMVKAL